MIVSEVDPEEGVHWAQVREHIILLIELLFVLLDQLGRAASRYAVVYIHSKGQGGLSRVADAEPDNFKPALMVATAECVEGSGVTVDRPKSSIARNTP